MFKRRQIRAIKRAFRKLFKRTWILANTVSKSVIDWFLRTVLLIGIGKGRQNHAKAGFVLPTVVMLLLVVTLVVATLLVRTQNRTSQVIGAREEQVIYNAATPAIERAKAKLEYLFTQDTRMPTGAVSDQLLLKMLVNDNSLYPELTSIVTPNPYTFEGGEEQGGETRLDLNQDGIPDPAWAYKADVDNDGIKETVVYGIYLRSRSDNNNISISGVLGTDRDGRPIPDANGRADTDKEKASFLVTRNGPINTINLNDPVCADLTRSSTTPPPPGTIRPVDESVWYPSGSGVLRKTFQVDAIVVSRKEGTSRTVATLEFQQDRQLDRANRWGAWFRYDMEIYPGFDFNWNGAMYSAGNIFISGDKFRAYLISSPKSCFYGKDSSEITVLEEPTPPGGSPQYQGQFQANRPADDASGSAKIDLQQAGGNNTDPDRSRNDVVPATLDTNSDSSTKSAGQVAINPVILFTQDRSSAIGGQSTNRDARDGGWDNRSLRTQGRFRNQQQNPPYVDDTYRADNRWGPKPRYDRVDSELWLNDSSRKNGQPIPNNLGDPKIKKLISNTTDPVADPEFRELGLDGYWERRAWANGLRVIVSPRLELGNTNGWQNNNDPLYPVATSTSHEQQQRRTLRDNLAAVQATVVYHHDSGLGNPAGDFPVACVATTAHPGTEQTDLNSRNFNVAGETYPIYTGATRLYSDFLTGKGTNGWEYTVHSQDKYSNGGALRNALQNLANFAGDPEGAFPPQQQSGQVNPDPYLTMWGNFSNLRRAMQTSYSELSIADKSYLHSAGCAVGMLAYNVNYFNNYNYSSDLTNLGNLENALRLLSDGNTANGEVNRTTGVVNINATTSYTVPTPVSTDVYLSLLTGDNQKLARMVAMKEQIERDRTLGFANSTPLTTPPTFDHDNSNTTAEIPLPQLACDPTTKFPGISVSGSLTTGARALGVLCPSQPKYPSLYYIFPTSSHARTTSQPPTEDYITRVGSVAVDGGQFTEINQANLTEIALAPKGENWTGGNNSAGGNWYLPTSDQPNPAPADQNDFRITTPSGNQNRFTSLIDTAFFDTREKMTVRALTLDLNLLRRGSVPNNNTWLPKSGIVYGFREDAAREDAIARPGSGTVGNNADPSSPSDPPLESNGLSRKPVDFKPDPDRRPYGFRLRNGQDLRRFPGGSVDQENPRGITFVSDNPVYIHGDFNFHSTDGTGNSLIEEFTDKIFNANQAPNWGIFYTRNTLDDRFGRSGSGKDTWRPAEILSDAITMLSNNFRKGYIDLGITQDGSNPRVSDRYSYRAINGPSTSSRSWLLEDGTVRSTTNNLLPIKVSRDGHPMYCDGTTSGVCPVASQRTESGYRSLDTNYSGDINQATETRVNAIVVSGIIPTRTGLQNGGLHNFPRYIENWQSVNSIINGAFVQLNFSTYATGPYTQNSSVWEPATNGTGGNNLYYWAPNRVWGYDVGLQYAPAGPMSQRFVASGKKRSEFYRDLQVDDPYICRLRLALNRLNGQDPASQRECN
ncbi:hormogonium polysaccharide biosynthesis protein HpsA [Aerosakkonemataceae cyanobacterium BLCC-F50]|uniref:Hormogonium polysaccharide biosynthesis protein HpsA n=1 Tax=Floridaenema flaviceps BLCC-F50 TaxID=3153642 RepID=A0ABV4XU57_9CYAN